MQKICPGIVPDLNFYAVLYSYISSYIAYD